MCVCVCVCVYQPTQYQSSWHPEHFRFRSRAEFCFNLIEEERRLAYVALSRAQEALCLSHTEATDGSEGPPVSR